MLRAIVIAAIALCVAGCASSRAPSRPQGFVDASSVVRGLAVDMRYAGANNFIGRPIAGYDAPVCVLTRDAADALAAVQRELARSDLGLKVFDCYRPARAVAAFVAWADDPNDRAQEARFYPRVDKSRLIAEGYIAARSGHSRGSTVDLTLIDANGRELDMGGEFDLFDTRSWPAEPNLLPAQRANRMRLREAMEAHGFRPYDKEWWHFTLVDEPHAETYFDFPITN